MNKPTLLSTCLALIERAGLTDSQKEAAHIVVPTGGRELLMKQIKQQDAPFTVKVLYLKKPGDLSILDKLDNIAINEADFCGKIQLYVSGRLVAADTLDAAEYIKQLAQ